jgi:hypothetical protein
MIYGVSVCNQLEPRVADGRNLVNVVPRFPDSTPVPPVPSRGLSVFDFGGGVLDSVQMVARERGFGSRLSSSAQSRKTQGDWTAKQRNTVKSRTGTTISTDGHRRASDQSQGGACAETNSRNPAGGLPFDDHGILRAKSLHQQVAVFLALNDPCIRRFLLRRKEGTLVAGLVGPIRHDRFRTPLAFTVILGLTALGTQISFASVLVPDGEKQLNEKYHAPLTTDVLLRALDDEVGAIRTAAAFRLAAQGQKDAIRPILAALSRERMPRFQVALAFAAAELGSDDGIRALEGMCANTGWTPTQRMGAAQTLGFFHNEECLGEVLSALRSQDDQAVPIALATLAHYEQVPTERYEEISSVVSHFLRSNNSVIRAYASDVLAKFGDASSAQELDTALAIEKEENARTAMKAALKALGASRETLPPR